ncbi:alpha/beta fold hydrolase [Kistimonas asteriae]|uniref:alpha/beta fold hydrolase n=1 Tax=Kistimonas asteriae TaxID=517724 RepID=UPI001BAAB7C8|nr:alpha/beta fold hydrolase [Kistimonas asteriae]
MPVKLFAKTSGAGKPVILIHGLFGAGDNLGVVARALASDYCVHLLDLRNHGASPHVDTMDYPSMASDVLAYMDDSSLEKAALLGHSMGGKVAMQLALDAPERVTGLIVADIAPVEYPAWHTAVFKGMFAVAEHEIHQRKEADRILAEHVTEPGVRQFLLRNLVRAPEGRYVWRVNLTGIHDSYHKIRLAPMGQVPYAEPVLFVKGERSDYIDSTHQETVLSLFPASQLKVVGGAGHWLHAEKPELFNRIVSRFLSGLND